MSWTLRANEISVRVSALCCDNGYKVTFLGPIMRRRIIEALTYPRMILLANLDAEECPQQLLFDPVHQRCQICEQGEECHWLNINDEFSVLAQKSMDSLYESLKFCIDYVFAQCTNASHNVRRCPCESCHWVRTARQLESDYRHMRQPH